MILATHSDAAYLNETYSCSRAGWQHLEIIYGASIQKPLEEETSPILYADGIKRIQGIVSTVIYHA